MSDAVLTCTYNQCFEQNKKNITIFHLKIIIFIAVKYCSLFNTCIYPENGSLNLHW